MGFLLALGGISIIYTLKSYRRKIKIRINQNL
jgi:hypothetical protein